MERVKKVFHSVWTAVVVNGLAGFLNIYFGITAVPEIAWLHWILVGVSFMLAYHFYQMRSVDDLWADKFSELQEEVNKFMGHMMSRQFQAKQTQHGIQVRLLEDFEEPTKPKPH